jgi:hypothetical protein
MPRRESPFPRSVNSRSFSFSRPFETDVYSPFARLSAVIHTHLFALFVLHRSTIKRLLISSPLRSRLFPPSERQFLLSVRRICQKCPSPGQWELRDERSVWDRPCKPRERQLRLPRSPAGRKKSHRWLRYGILYRQACDKRSRTSFINCEYESIKFDIARGRRGRMKARGRFFIPFVDRLPLKMKSCQRFVS